MTDTADCNCSAYLLWNPYTFWTKKEKGLHPHARVYFLSLSLYFSSFLLGRNQSGIAPEPFRKKHRMIREIFKNRMITDCRSQTLTSIRHETDYQKTRKILTRNSSDAQRMASARTPIHLPKQKKSITIEMIRTPNVRQNRTLEAHFTWAALYTACNCFICFPQ